MLCTKLGVGQRMDRFFTTREPEGRGLCATVTSMMTSLAVSGVALGTLIGISDRDCETLWIFNIVISCLAIVVVANWAVEVMFRFTGIRGLVYVFATGRYLLTLVTSAIAIVGFGLLMADRDCFSDDTVVAVWTIIYAAAPLLLAACLPLAILGIVCAVVGAKA